MLDIMDSEESRRALEQAEQLAEDPWCELIHGAQSQSKGLGVLVEADRRLVQTINRLNDSTTLQQETTNRLTRRIFWLTIALMVFAVVEIVLKVGPWVFGLFFK